MTAHITRQPSPWDFTQLARDYAARCTREADEMAEMRNVGAHYCALRDDARAFTALAEYLTNLGEGA